MPVNLAQFGLAADQTEALSSVVDGAMAFAPIHNLPFTVTPEKVLKAIVDADALGEQVIAAGGDDAYRRVQA